MTKKQIKKYADKFYELEKQHENPDLSAEEKSKVEQEMMKLTKMISAMGNGFEILEQIDEILRNKLQ